MNKENLLKTMNKLIIDIFEDETIAIDENTNVSDIKGWDSICKMMFIESVERELNIKISAKDALSLTNFSNFADIIIEKNNI